VRTRATAVALALLLAPAPASGAGSTLLERLGGTWQGEGTIARRPSKIAMTWAPHAGGRFIRVSWRNVMSGGERDVVFEGEGTYRAAPDSTGLHRGTWFDSQGALHPLAGIARGDSLVTEWGTAGATQGRTTYRLTGPDAMTVRDELRRGDAWVPFGTSAFVRSAPPAH
jgi:hypothetical protein